MPPQLARQQLEIDLEGPDLTPANVDSRALLGIASDYLDAFRSIAIARHVEIALTGVELAEAKPGIRVGVSDEEQAQEVAIVIAREIAPESKRPHLRTLSKRIASLPPEHRATVHLARIGWSAPLVPSHTAGAPRIIHEHTSRRLTVERAGGKRATVRFIDGQTGKRFTLTASKEHAAIAGQALYRRADVELVADLDPSNLRIIGGRLLDIRLLDDKPQTFDDMKKWWQSSFAGRSS